MRIIKGKYYSRTITGHLTNQIPVGFCSYRYHKGAITKGQMEDHCCDLKKCKHFHRNKDSPYWDMPYKKRLVRKSHKKKRKIWLRREVK